MYRYERVSMCDIDCHERNNTFWLGIETLPQWRHANTRYWDSDVIFLDFSCTCKLAQSRSSLENKNYEYRFTRHPVFTA